MINKVEKISKKWHGPENAWAYALDGKEYYTPYAEHECSNAPIGVAMSRDNHPQLHSPRYPATNTTLMIIYIQYHNPASI